MIVALTSIMFGNAGQPNVTPRQHHIFSQQVPCCLSCHCGASTKESGRSSSMDLISQFCTI